MRSESGLWLIDQSYLRKCTVDDYRYSPVEVLEEGISSEISVKSSHLFIKDIMHTTIAVGDTIAISLKLPTYVVNNQAWVPIRRTT